jgi:hypothetical protein
LPYLNWSINDVHLSVFTADMVFGYFFPVFFCWFARVATYLEVII